MTKRLRFSRNVLGLILVCFAFATVASTGCAMSERYSPISAPSSPYGGGGYGGGGGGSS